ncbi:hypothetical protein A3B26_02935 [Candidatus Giovannonibacteria bacterium RIFCSPLOWO2_01_FULL_48_47]|nr:MAG: hypothetical protein A3D61_04005 [Candidatus Giovannonibacteria bacterium RIFCSPHIGHO2_02_FULL_48_15]OGF88788.1 MAG: hypothetical protein A3B26_02935 [Candidatus Giovannonibacteria bacterium RIFCSPLOWO2_01_FULL_48_47]OGF96533.1 MAG: hypothetical protein A2613_03210 [Candidatus Giovannonibacteria bacterium RIFOXYD1_FULL_48_21]HBT81861.1 hypothetical protein [Candidatus Giovannonibacteria bacterium]
MENKTFNVSLILTFVVALIGGYILGFYTNWSKSRNLQRQLDTFLQRDAEVKKAEEDVDRSVKESQVTSSQIKKAEEDIIKSLTPR